jgi:hypothetical protein
VKFSFFSFRFHYEIFSLSAVITRPEGKVVRLLKQAWTEIAWSVWGLVTIWTVWGSNPGGARDLPPSYTPRLYLGPDQPTVRLVPGFFPEVERPGCGVNYSNLGPRFGSSPS